MVMHISNMAGIPSSTFLQGVSFEQHIINKYLGVPYVHKGRTPSGLDCYGLIVFVYRDLGFELFDMDNYDRNWSFKGRNLLLENYHKEWDKVEVPIQFDVVLFGGRRGVNHGGIVFKNDRFIHCCRQGTVMGKLGSERWCGKVEGFYHLKARK